jgi:hypothetical protein
VATGFRTHVCILAAIAGLFIDKILRGTKPSDLPIEQPTKVERVINLKMAKTLGITIPPSLLLRADEVVQRLSATSRSRAGTLRLPGQPLTSVADLLSNSSYA